MPHRGQNVAYFSSPLLPNINMLELSLLIHGPNTPLQKGQYLSARLERPQEGTMHACVK
jgi:hypothetical protein